MLLGIYFVVLLEHNVVTLVFCGFWHLFFAVCGFLILDFYIRDNFSSIVAFYLPK